MMEFEELQQQALAIRKRYEVWEAAKYGRSWTRAELVMGFVGDVGDMVKLAMAHDGVRHIPDHEARLAHELADCLWSVIVIADKYGVDLEQAFQNTMETLEEQLSEKG